MFHWMFGLRYNICIIYHTYNEILKFDSLLKGPILSICWTVYASGMVFWFSRLFTSI